MNLLLCQGYKGFISNIHDIFEQGLIDIKDNNIRNSLCEIVIDNQMNFDEVVFYARNICEFSRNKKICGEIVSLIITNANMQVAEAVAFAHEVTSFDFFLDLSGDFKQFLKCFRDDNEVVKVNLKNILSGRNKLKKKSHDESRQSKHRIIIDSDSEGGSHDTRSESSSSSSSSHDDDEDDRSSNDSDVELVESDEDDDGNLR